MSQPDPLTDCVDVFKTAKEQISKVGEVEECKEYCE